MSTAWETGAPAAHGVDPGALAQMDQQIAARLPHVRSFLVVRDGVLIHERYFRGAAAADRHEIASVNKSLISALTGIALEHKLISGVDQRVTAIIGDLCPPDSDPQIGRLTIRHLLTMTSGFYYPRLAADSQPVWERTLRSDHWVRFSLGLPVRDRMGLDFRYKNTDALLMAAILARVTGRTVGELAREWLFAPLGIEARWEQDDPQGMGTGVTRMTAREMARFGQLYLCGGEGIIPGEWVRESTAPQVKGYGYLWWVHPDGFAASGAGGQLIRVVWAKRLVILFQAEMRRRSPEPGDLVGRYLLPAVD